MSKRLPQEQVDYIREVFDYQLKNQDQTPAKSNKKQIPSIEDLKSFQQTVQAKMNRDFGKQHHDETMVPPASAEETWMRSSEDSFLQWEQDCEQTLRQPVAGQPTQPQAKRRADPDPDMAAIENLMREYNLDQVQDDVEAKDNLTVFDHTQLADIEPPSGIWDTTMVASPVKRVGALRQSTIAEEDSLDASSYETAGSAFSKMTVTTLGHDRYDTAAETFASEESKEDVIEILDDSLETRERKLSLTLDGISSLPDETFGTRYTTMSTESGVDSSSEVNSYEASPQFNDTLERIEFMERQGKKLLEQQKTPYKPPNHSLLPCESSGSKKVFYPSPGSFKKPNSVRSPQIKFVPSRRNFDHIVSPVATYIKDVPSSTLVTKYKGMCLFSKNSSPVSSPSKARGETKENVVAKGTAAAKATGIPQTQWTIPRKVFTSTNNRHEIDNRLPTKIPGGNKVQRIIGPALTDPHKIIRHEGRIKMNHPGMDHGVRESIFDESLANLSMVSGDVSIQVIGDIKKK